jgi:hypothetical protein
MPGILTIVRGRLIAHIHKNDVFIPMEGGVARRRRMIPVAARQDDRTGKLPNGYTPPRGNARTHGENDMNADDTSSMDDLFSAFVLSIVAVSFLVAPAIIAAGYAMSMRRILRGG